MKIQKTFIAVITASSMCWGCTSSDTTMNDTSAISEPVEQEITEDKSGSQDPMDPDTDMTAESGTNDNVSANNQIGRDMNIVALVQQNPELSTLLELIRAADMVRVLESPAPYTVFAPTNAAFAALPAGTIEILKKSENKMELKRILQAHILPNRISSNEIQNNMPMITAMGEEVVATRQGQTIKVGDATILTPDVEASNGIVHVVDKVLLPPSE